MVSVKQIVPGYRLRGGRIWLCLGGTSGGHTEPLYFISEWAMAWKTTTDIATNNPPPGILKGNTKTTPIM